jgi:hypothetical protein
VAGSHDQIRKHGGSTDLGDTSLTLADALMSLPQLESGGMTAADRFDYQKDWALCKLLELHESSADYVLLCEFHDDVAVLDSATTPTQVTFYQIKTDDKNRWTVTRLTRRTKGKGDTLLPSILGRLCGKKLETDKSTVAYRFASNARFNIKSDAGGSLESSDQFLCGQIEQKERQKLLALLSDELQVPIPNEMDTTLGFEVSSLALSSHANATTGKLAQFIDHYAHGCAVQTRTLYRALFDEIRRRTSAARPATSFADVCSAKGLSRKLFDQMLQAALKATPADRTWGLIQQTLTMESVPLKRRIELDQGFKRYFARRLNPLDTPLHRVRTLAVGNSMQLMDASPGIKLLDLAEGVLSVISALSEFESSQLDDDAFLALVMIETYEANEPEVPSTGSEST